MNKNKINNMEGEGYGDNLSEYEEQMISEKGKKSVISIPLYSIKNCI
jgi:hypothetical protein